MILDYLSNVNSSNRHNVVILRCTPTTLDTVQSQLIGDGVEIIDCGKYLAKKCERISNKKFLTIEIQESLQEVVLSKAKTIVEGKPKVVVLHNLGILVEPSLGLDPLTILEKLSQNTALLIIWEHQLSSPAKLHWGSNEEHYNIDFSNTSLTKVYTYEV